MMTLIDRLGLPFGVGATTLRAATIEDGPSIFAYRADPEVARWLTRQQADPAAWRLEFDTRRTRTVVVERADVVIGDLGVIAREAIAQAEVADRAMSTEAELTWAFAPSVHGTGIATNVVAALVDACFQRAGLHRVVAGSYRENTSSIRLMERVGMRRESLEREAALHRDGTWRDYVTYAKLAAETTSAAPADPTVVIRYCTQCRWQLRAQWYQGELLQTFAAVLGGVMLVPTTGGMFRVEVDQGDDTITVWNRKTDGGFPEITELKRRVRDLVAPDLSLGHADR